MLGLLILLLEAVRHGMVDVVKVLLQRGADVSVEVKQMADEGYEDINHAYIWYV